LTFAIARPENRDLTAEDAAGGDAAEEAKATKEAIAEVTEGLDRVQIPKSF
jgi:hypothetical protein